MSFFHWCMRYGAAILFVIAGLQLAVGLILVLQTFGAAVPSSSRFGGGDEGSPLRMLLMLQGLLSVLGAAALPFFGACLLHRLDRRHRADPREAEPFE
jgi:hypothetical protein